MSKTIIERLGEFGQSIWLDNINRSIIESGRLEEMIGLGLRGMTSNPAIFDKAIRLTNEYDTKIEELANLGKSTFGIYDDLTVRDVQEAADIFRKVYDKTNRLDGYVSLEVNPELAFNIEKTVVEARRLFKKVDRANVMFKVPATNEGCRVIEELCADGMNINATLIFSLEQYEKTAQAFLEGMRRLHKRGKYLRSVYSVASVFVSRIDSVVDSMIDERIVKESDSTKKAELESLKGKAAIANSKLIFHRYKELFSGEAFNDIRYQGANAQRVLWASTSTKNPAYSDIKYVVELIGKGTVNTLPGDTLQAFLDHGAIEESLTSDSCDAQDVVKALKDFDIDINDVCLGLLNDGVSAFEKSFSVLLSSIEQKREVLYKGR